MVEDQKSWASHLLSLVAVIAFGLMSLACFDIENLDPVEGEIFWEFPPAPVHCNTLNEPVAGDHKKIDFVVLSREEDASRVPLEDVSIDVSFSFYPSDWTGELDDNGDPICTRSLDWSSTQSVFTDASGITGYISSPPITWTDSEDILIVSWRAYKSGYTSHTGSSNFYISFPDQARSLILTPLNPN